MASRREMWLAGHVGARCRGPAVSAEAEDCSGEALLERVGPLQPVETGEIAIRRAQDEPMLDGESGQVSVRYEVSSALCAGHEGCQYFPVACGGQRNPGRLRGQPRLYLLPGCQHRYGTFEDSRIADNSDKCQKARPRQTHGRSTTESPIQPLPRGVVLRERADGGVHQQVCIDEDHRNRSPSPAASTSATSSRLPTMHRPRSTVGVRYRTGGSGGTIMCRRPSRKASFTTVLKLPPWVCRTRLSRAATSGSNVRVVLMHRSIDNVMH